jgi:hypothetical protein
VPVATKVENATHVVFEYQLFDKNGNPKKIWKENRLGKFFREKFKQDIQRWPFGKAVGVIKNTAKIRRK